MPDKGVNTQKMDTDNQNNVVISMRDVTKTFRVYNDKSHTFKDRILFGKRNGYERHVVLNHISFSAEKGQAIGLIGHNGCGKSTTLKLLNRILYPDSGTIEMKGRISSLIELGAGFHPDMSGRENIYINASIFGLKKKEIDQRLEDIIRFSELEQFIDTPVRTYSSGMYMRLAFAIAINVDADILLVDEILAVGDVRFQKKCFDKLMEIKRNGATIVIVSHTMEQIRKICDRVLWLENGKIYEDGSAKKVCDDYLWAMGITTKPEEPIPVSEEEGDQTPEENPDEVPIEESEPETVQTVEAGDVIYRFPPGEICSQATDEAGREGNMQVRFSLIELLNGDMELCQRFHFGNEINIRFEIAIDDSLDLQNKMVNVVFNILNGNGILCSSLSTTSKTGAFMHVSDLKSGILKISHNSLGFGDYFLDAVLKDENGEEYDCLGHLIRFFVTSPYTLGVGITAMENEWIWKEHSKIQ